MIADDVRATETSRTSLTLGCGDCRPNEVIEFPAERSELGRFVKATIILDGSDWVAALERGTSLRFPRSFYGERAWLEARAWAESRGARVIDWVPCPLLKEHSASDACTLCGHARET